MIPKTLILSKQSIDMVGFLGYSPRNSTRLSANRAFQEPSDRIIQLLVRQTDFEKMWHTPPKKCNSAAFYFIQWHIPRQLTDVPIHHSVHGNPESGRSTIQVSVHG